MHVRSLMGNSFLVAVIVGVSWASLAPVAAQTVETVQASAPSDLRARGEALIYGQGDVAADVPAGLALLGQAAEQGDLAAKASLGKILLDGYYTAADTERALGLLEAAAQGGHAKARMSLGGALLWGTGTEPNPERARTLLQLAADAGEREAQRILGEQLIGGWVYPRDVAAGLPLLEAAITAGDVPARVALGDFLLYGIGLPKDELRALALYEEAAAKGNGKGLMHYGEALMWSERDASAAEEYLERAGSLGQGHAWSILAEGAMYGYLGGGNFSRHKFDGYAEKARAAGDPQVEVLDAIRQMWGISMVASGPKTLERLHEAAAGGNAEAATFLVELLRDGNAMNVMKDRDAARAALAQYGSLLDPLDQARYAWTIDAAEARRPSAYAKIAEAFVENPEWKTAWLGRALYKASPNSAIYILQSQMKADGLYRGPLDGLAGPLTLRGLYRACRALDDASACDDSVLRPDVIGTLLMR